MTRYLFYKIFAWLLIFQKPVSNNPPNFGDLFPPFDSSFEMEIFQYGRGPAKHVMSSILNNPRNKKTGHGGSENSVPNSPESFLSVTLQGDIAKQLEAVMKQLSYVEIFNESMVLTVSLIKPRNVKTFGMNLISLIGDGLADYLGIDKNNVEILASDIGPNLIKLRLQILNVNDDQLNTKLTKLCLTDSDPLYINHELSMQCYQLTFHPSNMDKIPFCQDKGKQKIVYWNETINSITNDRVYIATTGKYYKTGDYIGTKLTLRMTNTNESKIELPLAIVCEDKLELLCDGTTLLPGSFEFINNGSAIRVGNEIIKLFNIGSDGKLHTCHASAFFCVNTEWENIAVAVFLSVSTVFLILLLVTLFMVPEISRSIPGFNLINLVLTIITMQVLFLSSFLWKNCWLLAVARLYLILLNFSWSSIIGFHVFRIFYLNKYLKIPSQASIRSRIVSFLVAHLTVTSIVICALVAEYFETSIKPKFGPSSGTCWIGTQNGSIVFYALPVLMSIIINVIFYSASFIEIRNTMQISVNVTGKKYKIPNQLKVFVRLSVILTLSWITSLFTLVFDSHGNRIVAYIFVLINTNQGVLLFIFFICNKRVIQMWKSKLAKIGFWTRMKRFPVVYTLDSTKMSSSESYIN